MARISARKITHTDPMVPIRIATRPCSLIFCFKIINPSKLDIAGISVNTAAVEIGVALFRPSNIKVKYMPNVPPRMK